MTPDAGQIPVALLGMVWRDLWPLLEPAFALSPEKDDLLAGIYARRFQLWAVYDKTVPVGCIVTRLNRRAGTSDRLDCRVWLVGGKKLSRWAPSFLEKLIPWAKAEGAEVISGAGRRGWARVVPHLGFDLVGDENGCPVWELVI
jgi:hypothetical protein